MCIHVDDGLMFWVASGLEFGHCFCPSRTTVGDSIDDEALGAVVVVVVVGGKRFWKEEKTSAGGIGSFFFLAFTIRHL